MPNRKRKQINIGDTFRWTGPLCDRESIWRILARETWPSFRIQCIQHSDASSIGYITSFFMDGPEWEPYDDFDTWVREVRANHANGRRSGREEREGIVT